MFEHEPQGEKNSLIIFLAFFFIAGLGVTFFINGCGVGGGFSDADPVVSADSSSTSSSSSSSSCTTISTDTDTFETLTAGAAPAGAGLFGAWIADLYGNDAISVNATNGVSNTQALSVNWEDYTTEIDDALESKWIQNTIYPFSSFCNPSYASTISLELKFKSAATTTTNTNVLPLSIFFANSGGGITAYRAAMIHFNAATSRLWLRESTILGDFGNADMSAVNWDNGSFNTLTLEFDIAGTYFNATITDGTNQATVTGAGMGAISKTINTLFIGGYAQNGADGNLVLKNIYIDNLKVEN